MPNEPKVEKLTDLPKDGKITHRKMAENFLMKVWLETIQHWGMKFVDGLSHNIWGGIRLVDVKFLRKNVRGIKGAILSRNGEVLDADTEPDMDVPFLSANVFYLIDFINKKNKDVRTVSIAGESHFFIFVQDTLLLSVAASPDVNVPLVNVVGRHILDGGKE